jgi:hypothetical protein
MSEQYKIEVCKTDYYGKQFGRSSVPLETLAAIEKNHGKEAVKDALYEMYNNVKEVQ